MLFSTSNYGWDNVIGYAIGKQKRVYLILNESLNPQKKEIRALGLLDTIGYKPYQNSGNLARIIGNVSDFRPLNLPAFSIDKKAPVYIIDTLYKTDASVHILSKIKKARLFFRSFDPTEQSRLSTLEAYRNVAQSVVIIVPLISTYQTDWQLNNFRGAFVAGICHGCDKEVLILQEVEDPVPMDYRDLVCVYKHPEDLDRYLNPLGPKVVETLQSISDIPVPVPEGFLEKVDLGSPAAENEVMNLRYYYMKTDQYNQVIKTGSRLAVGRKGSGKTALFFQARDKLRRNKAVFVLDLKPQGHQLKRFKQLVLDLLSEAVREHTATAFWEYVLYLELCYKILEKDKQIHIHDHTLFEAYQELAKLYSSDIFVAEADFSERMLKLVNRVSEIFHDKFGDGKEKYLTAGQVTGFIYQHNVPKLRKRVIQYLQNKDSVFVFFDNIDKGWPTRGIGASDILIVRALLDATRKVEREFQKDEIDIHTTVFLRNDVYELLVQETLDRGKESRVSLDWTDSDYLRELLRRRIVYNGLDPKMKFEQAWNQICTSHIHGEDSADFLISRAIMRPRNVLNLVNHCKSNAVNLRHEKINEDDIQKALEIYSEDVSNEIGLEIRDVFPEAEDVLYRFIGSHARLSLSKIQEYLNEPGIPSNIHIKIIEILLWFGFMGVVIQRLTKTEEYYIYDVQYDIKKLKKLAKDLKNENVVFCINCAFWPFLGIDEQ